MSRHADREVALEPKDANRWDANSLIFYLVKLITCAGDPRSRLEV